jgi:hypothetical protein
VERKLKRNTYGILIEKQEEKRLLGRPRHKYDGNIKMDIKEIGWEDVDWVDFTQDWKHCSEPSGSTIFWKFD